MMKQNTQADADTMNRSSPPIRGREHTNHTIRRTLEGHTRPCEECAAVDWQLDASRGEITCN